MRPALGIWLFHATAAAALLAGHAMALPKTPAPVPACTPAPAPGAAVLDARSCSARLTTGR